MEADEACARYSQSNHTAPTELRCFDDRPSQQHHHHHTVMATAALINPANSFKPHQHAAYPPPYLHYPPASAVSGMDPSMDARRISDDGDAPQRQSLPSLQEVINGKPGGFPAPAQSSSHTLPTPFTPAAATLPRPFECPAERRSSPPLLHPATAVHARPEPLQRLADPGRGLVNARPVPPPTHSFVAHRQFPPSRPPCPVDLQRGGEAAVPRLGNIGYPPLQHHPPYSAAPASQPLYPQTGRLPPGQVPLGPYPTSPGRKTPATSSSFENLQPPSYYDEEFDHARGNEMRRPTPPPLEPGAYADHLNCITAAARTIYNFAEAYDVVRLEAEPHVLPGRLPTAKEVSTMLDTAFLMGKKMESLREMMAMNTQRQEQLMRERGNCRSYDEDDMPMYGSDVKPYGNSSSLTDVKKRRGRAAPPGRCHSCNRIDTPEWRRGPDGARTLCNACGLHYAKLERKRQMEQRSIRPKPSEE